MKKQNLKTLREIAAHIRDAENNGKIVMQVERVNHYGCGCIGAHIVHHVNGTRSSYAVGESILCGLLGVDTWCINSLADALTSFDADFNIFFGEDEWKHASYSDVMDELAAAYESGDVDWYLDKTGHRAAS